MEARRAILVVDDEPDVVRSLKELLRLEFRVLGASRADEGLAVLAREPVAVVMSDQRMPGRSGVEFLRDVRARYPDATRLLLTGYADLRAVIDAINQGSVYRYVAKPWDPDELVGIVREAARLHDLVVERELLVASLRAANDELRAARDELARSEAKYRLLFEHNPNPVWVADAATGRILAVNEQAVRHYGYPRERFLAMRRRDLEADDAPPGPAAARRHRRADGGEIHVEERSEAVEFDGRPAELVMAHDVTVRRRLEEHFHRNQKMEALGLMAGGIAHDFGNVMSTVLLAARVLLDGMPEGDPQRALADEVLGHAERGAALTRQLMAFSRRQPGTLSRVDINAVVGDLDRMIRRVLGPRVEVRIDRAPSLPEVVADRAQLEQVVLNLVVNARDAVGERGRVEVATRALRLDAERPEEYAAVAPGRYVALAVTDDGAGIDAATQRRIFEPFFTTKAEGLGTGLGLSTVFSIVRQHGGDIRVESAPGRGARFEVLLPEA